MKLDNDWSIRHVFPTWQISPVRFPASLPELTVIMMMLSFAPTAKHVLFAYFHACLRQFPNGSQASRPNHFVSFHEKPDFLVEFVP